MEHFSYKGGCSLHEHTRIKVLREGLVWVIDKQLQLMIMKMLFKTVIATTKNLRNKVIFNLKQYCMCYYVSLAMYSSYCVQRCVPIIH